MNPEIAIAEKPAERLHHPCSPEIAIAEKPAERLHHPYSPEIAIAEKPAERLHHPYSPSKLNYLLVCPSYASETSDTEASRAGTAQHNSAETGDIDEELSDAQAHAVASVTDYVRQIAARYPNGSWIIKETYLPIDGARVTDSQGKVFIGTTGGYLDWGIVSATEEEADIVDYKFGLWSVPPAEENLQGHAYLLGLLKRYPKLKKVTIHFLMPHRDEIDSHTFTADQFPMLRLKVEAVVRRAMAAQTTGETRTSVSTCLFCANKGTCPALAEFALKLGNKYEPLLIPDNLTPSLMRDAETATQAMGVAQVLEGWCKAVRRQITERTIESENWTPKGYKLRSRTDKEIVDWRKLVKLARECGADPKALAGALTVKLTPLNKAVSASAPRGSKEKMVDEFQDRALAEGILVKENPIYFLERIKS